MQAHIWMQICNYSYDMQR